MSEYTEADMKFDSDPLMQEEDYVEGEEKLTKEDVEKLGDLRKLMDNAAELNKILPGHHYVHVPWGGEPYIRWAMPIQSDSAFAAGIPVSEPEPYVPPPPAVLSEQCFQLYMDLLPAVYCILGRGRVSMGLIYEICCGREAE